MQVGAGPPFQNPPPFGILGAPSAPPFGPRGGTWRSREEGLRRPGGALASGNASSAPPPSRPGSAAETRFGPTRGANSYSNGPLPLGSRADLPRHTTWPDPSWKALIL